MQHGGVALWIIAIGMVVLVLFAWGVLVQVAAIRRQVAPAAARPQGPPPRTSVNFPGPESAKSPAQPGEG